MLTHYLALRRRLLRSLVFFCFCFVLCFYSSTQLLHELLFPLLKVLPDKAQLVLTRVESSLFLSIELAGEIALFLTIPHVLFEFWQFALPGLYAKERQQGWFFLIGSLSLFTIGVLFCFYLILPYLFQFLVHYAPADLHLMLDASETIHLIFKMVTFFGFCFQLPLICVLLERIRWLSLSQLISARRFVIVGAFIVGMFLAPPDVCAQILIALPLCFLFEIGLVCVKFFKLKESSKPVVFFKDNQ